MKKKFNKRTIWILVGAIVIVAAIVLVNIANNAKQSSDQTYQTVTLKKGELVAIVGATGSVRANQSATLSWQTSGRIEKINLKVGDQVTAGDAMASLALDSLPQAVILAQSDLVGAQKTLRDLMNSKTSSSTAELNLAQAQSDYYKALGNYWYKDKTQGSDNLITITRAKLQLADNKIVDLKHNYDHMAELPDNNSDKAQALANLTQAQIDRDNTKRLLDYYEANPDALDVQTLQAKLDLAKAKLEDAKREWERLKDGPDAKDIAAAEARVAAIQATVSMSTLQAPFTGTVTELDSMVGDLVNAGTVTFRIDNLNRLLVDVQVPEVDINSIKVDQPANLSFDAIANKQYTAKVIEVARVGDTVSGIVNFKVTLQMLDADDNVLPGMTAAVNITVSQLENILTIPNRAVRLVNEKHVIYLLQNN